MKLFKDESNFKLRIPRIFPVKCSKCNCICKKTTPITRHDIYKDMILYKCTGCGETLYVNDTNYININT